MKPTAGKQNHATLTLDVQAGAQQGNNILEEVSVDQTAPLVSQRHAKGCSRACPSVELV